LGSCVHYGAHFDGFRLVQFQRPLDPAWNLVREYGSLSYLPSPEPVRLWELTETIAEGTAAPVEEVGPETARELLRLGMLRFDAVDCPGARRYYRALVERFPNAREAPDAVYFEAICSYRDSDWRETIATFENLVATYPTSTWVPGAYYHMGLCWSALGDREKARALWERVATEFPAERTLAQLARDRLAEMGAQASLLQRLTRWLRLR